MKKKIQPSSLRRTFTTLLKIWAQAPDSTVRKGTKHKHAAGKGNMAHYVDQCKTDLSSPGKHLHELRKRTLLLERLRHVQPKYLCDEKGNNCVPAELRELNRLIDASGVSTDTALKIQQMQSNTSEEHSLPPMISYPTRLPAPHVNNSDVPMIAGARVQGRQNQQRVPQGIMPIINYPQVSNSPNPYQYGFPFAGYQQVQQSIASPSFVFGGGNPVNRLQHSLDNFYPQTTASRVTHSKTLSISASGEKLLQQEKATEIISVNVCEPTISLDKVDSIPKELLQSVLEANTARVGRFCSQQYIHDPTFHRRTSKICSVINKIREKLQ